ncbi:MAG: exonuclease domain-containing protein [Limnochordia bacterium]|jgi:DNA polymerase-3 subunit epsilon
MGARGEVQAHLVQREGAAGRIGCGAFLDVETTGLSPTRNEIVELAIILFAFDELTGRITGTLDEYVGLREPECEISQDAIAVHGITEAMVKGRRLSESRIRAVLDRAEFVVAHNAPFDYGFVIRLFPEAAAKPWLCSMRQVNWRAYGYRSRGLQSLLAAHAIPVDVAHRAADDCRGALHLLNHASPRGLTYFDELLQSLANPAVGMPIVPA